MAIATAGLQLMLMLPPYNTSVYGWYKGLYVGKISRHPYTYTRARPQQR